MPALQRADQGQRPRRMRRTATVLRSGAGGARPRTQGEDGLLQRGRPARGLGLGLEGERDDLAAAQAPRILLVQCEGELRAARAPAMSAAIPCALRGAARAAGAPCEGPRRCSDHASEAQGARRRCAAARGAAAGAGLLGPGTGARPCGAGAPAAGPRTRPTRAPAASGCGQAAARCSGAAAAGPAGASWPGARLRCAAPGALLVPILSLRAWARAWACARASAAVVAAPRWCLCTLCRAAPLPQGGGLPGFIKRSTLPVTVKHRASGLGGARIQLRIAPL